MLVPTLGIYGEVKDNNGNSLSLCDGIVIKVGYHRSWIGKFWWSEVVVVVVFVVVVVVVVRMLTS